MKTQHTPGPWKTITGENLSGVDTRWITNGERFIADLGKVGGPVDSEANARLIAAAPELLQALEACFMQFEHNGDESPEDAEVLNQARAAIAKATA